MEKEFINGLYLSYENAKSLFEEAFILEKHQKTSRAYCLFHLSLEECGRFHLIYNCLNDYIFKEITAKDFNFKTLKKRGYEDHKLKVQENFDGVFKMTYIMLAISKKTLDTNQFEIESKKEIEELTKAYKTTIKIKDELNDLKNKSLYVTFKDNKFNSPDELIIMSEYIRIKNLTTLGLNAIENLINFQESKGGFDKIRENIKNGK